MKKATKPLCAVKRNRRNSKAGTELTVMFSESPAFNRRWRAIQKNNK